MEPSPGAHVGAYRIDHKVGEGAFGAVWCGTNDETGERVALKVLLPAAAADPEQVSRFQREAQLLALVHSPNVARMVDFRIDEQFGVVLMMELIDGQLLSELLARGILSVDATMDLGVQLLDGVCDLHAAGIVHRDLKPNNIILRTHEDGSRHAVIFDLGLSRMAARPPATPESTDSITGSGVALGTIECMAPEQILNAREATPRSDIYAAGSILYRALTGRYPFAAESDPNVARKKLTVETPPIVIAPTDPIAQGLRAIITQATRRRPADRYTSARAMRAELIALRDLGRARAAATPAPGQAADPVERSQRAQMPTLMLEDRPPQILKRRLTAFFVGISVFCLLVGAALAWRSFHP